jgi:hypothetical protein
VGLGRQYISLFLVQPQFCSRFKRVSVAKLLSNLLRYSMNGGGFQCLTMEQVESILEEEIADGIEERRGDDRDVAVCVILFFCEAYVSSQRYLHFRVNAISLDYSSRCR